LPLLLWSKMPCSLHPTLLPSAGQEWPLCTFPSFVFNCSACTGNDAYDCVTLTFSTQDCLQTYHSELLLKKVRPRKWCEDCLTFYSMIM
jgi:hypothetical protein